MKTKTLTAVLVGALGALPTLASADYLFSAPPRETPAQARKYYQPIADFLTKATGEKFVYDLPVSWPTYAKNMKTGAYDLVFDGPHFVSWRIDNIQHTALVKLPQPHEWRIIARKNDPTVNDISDLEAKRVCGPASPNFGTLIMMSHFNNPVREPVHIITKGWKDGYNAMLAGKCQATVLPKTNHVQYDPQGEQTKLVYQQKPYPNQAFTAGPRMSPDLKERVRQALLSPAGQQAMALLRERYAGGKELINAQDTEYAGVGAVLDRAVGFGIFAY